jgi:hypothetical protein
MSEISSHEAEVPERFDIPELERFYKYPFKRSGHEWIMCPPGRNEPCVCGSGKKLKKCCGEPDRKAFQRLVHTINEWFKKSDEQLERERQRAQNPKPMSGLLVPLLIGASLSSTSALMPATNKH